MSEVHYNIWYNSCRSKYVNDIWWVLRDDLCAFAYMQLKIFFIIGEHTGNDLNYFKQMVLNGTPLRYFKLNDF